MCRLASAAKPAGIASPPRAVEARCTPGAAVAGQYLTVRARDATIASLRQEAAGGTDRVSALEGELGAARRQLDERDRTGTAAQEQTARITAARDELANQLAATQALQR